MELETVKVWNWKPGGKGHIIINKRDFDAAIHRLASEPKPRKRRKAKPKS